MARPLGPTRTAREDAEAAAARLFAEHSDEILGYCLCQLKARPEAEDAVQTTFLYALRALRRGVVPECEPAWLTAIAKNVCRWQRRTLARRGPLASDVDLDRVGLARADGDEEELLAGLKDALASLPERQRRALLLREWQGLPCREIATRLEMTPTATYALLTRARRSLARALTAPQRPVLGLDLGTLLYQLRFQLRALIGGAGAKAATATVVVGVAISGVTVERALNDERSTSHLPVATVPGAGADADRAGGASTARSGVSRTPRARRPPDVTPAGVQSVVIRPQAPQYSDRAILPPAQLPGGESLPGSAADPAAPPRADPGPTPPLPVDLPPVPDVPMNLVPPDLLPPLLQVRPLPGVDVPSPPPAPELALPPLP